MTTVCPRSIATVVQISERWSHDHGIPRTNACLKLSHPGCGFSSRIPIQVPIKPAVRSVDHRRWMWVKAMFVDRFVCTPFKAGHTLPRQRTRVTTTTTETCCDLVKLSKCTQPFLHGSSNACRQLKHCYNYKPWILSGHMITWQRFVKLRQAG